MLLVLPVASLENGKIAYSGVYVMNPDGTEITFLRSGYNPDWSPDGNKIVFDHSGICVMNSVGSGLTRLTNDGYNPAWSPDGSKIAFESSRDGNNEIYIMNADGTGQTRLTNNLAEDKHPDWSPDGQKIVFQSSMSGLYEIYVMNADGIEQTRLTYCTVGNNGCGQPAWSEDNSKIAFILYHGEQRRIYTMNPDGTGQTWIRTNGIAWDPAWSPDGNKIVYTSDDLRPWIWPQIFVTNVDGSGWIQLTNNPAGHGASAWGRVPNQRPVASAGEDRTVIVNELVTLDGSGSTDSDGTITTYTWDYGDTNSGSGVSTSHTYTAAGTYTVTLTVTDNEGLTGSDTAVITVTTPGSLEVKSSPSHAKIYINDIDTGKIAKWTFDDLAPGDYDVFVTLDGYTTPETEKVTVVSGQTAELHFMLKKDGTPAPEFPTTILPGTIIIGFLSAVLFIQRTKNN